MRLHGEDYVRRKPSGLRADDSTVEDDLPEFSVSLTYPENSPDPVQNSVGKDSYYETTKSSVSMDELHSPLLDRQDLEMSNGNSSISRKIPILWL